MSDSEGLGMDHPLVMARMQAGIDGVILAAEGVTLEEAIKSTIPRIRMLFGDDIPRELIEVAVTVAFCSRPEARIPRRTDEGADG